MTTENLREFITLAEIGNYAAAADPLFISEATLSRHIMALENELGAPLFDRRPRRLELTALGIVFMPFAQQIVAAEDACQRTVAHRQDQNKGILSISFDPTLAFYDLAPLLADFKAAHPDLILQITEEGTFTLRELVLEGKVQFGYILYDEANRNEALQYRPFCQDTLAVALPANHPLAAQERILLNRLNGESLLLPPTLTATYELCMKAFRKSNFEPNSVITARLSGKAALELVKHGICLAVMPKQAALAAGDGTIAVREIAPRFTLETALIYRPEALGQTGQQYLNYIDGGAGR